jgi:ribosomal protein L34E
MSMGDFSMSRGYGRADFMYRCPDGHESVHYDNKKRTKVVCSMCGLVMKLVAPEDMDPYGERRDRIMRERGEE